MSFLSSSVTPWTDDYLWEDDEVLMWISIYWFSRAGPTTSIMIYYETMERKSNNPIPLLYPKIPMGVSIFPTEINVLPRAWIRRGNQIVAEFEYERRHFPAHERPYDLANDLWLMFGKGGGVYGVVPGKDGYA